MAYMNILKFHSVQLPPINSRIVLTNPEKTSYTSGDTITGELFLSCQKDIYSFGIKVALEGRAMVKFKDQGSQSRSLVILETFTYVFGKGEQRLRLQPGDHRFGFSLDLPISATLPGSFRSPFGLILYQIVAYVQLEWNLVPKAEKTITISSYMNLSPEAFPGLSNPVSYERTEKSLLPSILTRRLTPQFRFNFRMTQSGFLIGEEIPFELEVDYPSSYEITSLIVSLIQKITYSAGTASKVKQKVITKVQTGTMDSPNGTLWTKAIQVPQGTLPNQKGIIDISYRIKIEVMPSGQVYPLKGEVAVTIGTTRESLASLKQSCADENLLLGVKCTKQQRDRSPSPCPLTSATTRSSRPTHKSLDRADSATSRVSTHPGPPRYSVLSVRSSSIETLPPTYEDVVKEGDSAERPETAEFKKFAEEESQEEDDEETVDSPEVEIVDISAVEIVDSPDVEKERLEADISSKL